MPKEREEKASSSRHARDKESDEKKTEYWTPMAREYRPIQMGSIDGTDVVPHDKAIIRALDSDYTPNKLVKGKPSHTVFVGRLNERTTQDKIFEEFSKLGKIVHCRLIKDIVTGKSKCYAFVEYQSSSSARRAFKEMNRAYIDMEEILVDYEMERTMPGWKPRRLGGGFGGMKEAGQLRFGCRSRPFLKPIVAPPNKTDAQSKREHSDRDRNYHHRR